MAVSSITGKKKAVTIAKAKPIGGVSSIGKTRTVLRDAPTRSTTSSKPVSRSTTTSSRNTSQVSSIGGSTKKKATGQVGGTKPFKISDRIRANNGLAPVTTPEIPEVPTTPTDVNQPDDRLKLDLNNNIDAQPMDTPEDSSWAGVDRETGLTEQELLAQDEANLLEQQRALEDEQQTLKYIDQGKFIERNQEAKKYAQDQEALRLEAETISKESADIQAESQIRKVDQQNDNLKQNIGFLGQMGQPGVAKAALDAVSKQLVNADKVRQDLWALEENRNQISSIGAKSNAMAFSREMQQLQNNLDDNVSKVVQDAFNKVVMLDGDGKLDSMDEVTALKREILASVDTSIEGITLGNIQERQRAIDNYMALIEDQKIVVENAQKFNPEKSAATGVYTDMNGNPRLDAATGLPIPMPVEPPMAPIFDKETGNLITFSYGEDGEIVANVNQVVKIPGKQEPRKWNPDTQTYYRTSPDGKFETTTDPNDPSKTNNSEGPQGNSREDVANYSYDKRGRTNLQCGELVNDYREKVTGQRAGAGDDFASKRNAINNIGASDGPVIGGLFAIETGDPAGHIGIVTGINEDGSIEVLDANAAGGNGSEAQHNQYGADLVANMIFSQAPQGDEGSSKQFTSAQENMMGGMDAKNLTNMDRQMLSKNGLTETDLYNYKASKRAGKWTEGLEDYEIKRVNAVMDDFDTSTISTSFAKIQEAYTFADAVSKGENSSDNQGLIYAFAKAMDPDSVVREGEYATALKYSQTLLDQYGMKVNRVLNGEEFITEDARKNMVNTIKTKYEAGKSNYETLRSNKIKIINDIAGKDIGEKVLPSMVNIVGSSGASQGSYNPVYQNYQAR